MPRLLNGCYCAVRKAEIKRGGGGGELAIKWNKRRRTVWLGTFQSKISAELDRDPDSSRSDEKREEGRCWRRLGGERSGAQTDGR